MLSPYNAHCEAQEDFKLESLKTEVSQQQFKKKKMAVTASEMLPVVNESTMY